MELLELPPTQLMPDFERFRVIEPGSVARMVRSIEVYGQLSPVLAGRYDRTLLLVDGFKRLRATQALKVERLLVACIECPQQTLKAMMLTVNQEPSPYKKLEESLLLRSLHREDGLQQQEIALLCNRHKSWVCRRIALIERLNDEVVERVRLGLLPISTAWELVRLQRRNQNDVLTVISEHRLSSRQSRLLVDAFLVKPEWQRKALLEHPASVIDDGVESRIDCGTFTPMVLRLRRESDKLGAHIKEAGVGTLTDVQRQFMRNTLARIAVQLTSQAAAVAS